MILSGLELMFVLFVGSFMGGFINRMLFKRADKEESWSYVSFEQNKDASPGRKSLSDLLMEGYEPFSVTVETRFYYGSEEQVYVYHLKKRF